MVLELENKLHEQIIVGVVLVGGVDSVNSASAWCSSKLTILDARCKTLPPVNTRRRGGEGGGMREREEDEDER